MTIHRDKGRDLAATKAVMQGLREVAPDGKQNWLGHFLVWRGKRAGAAAIDQLLLSGATRSEMESTRGAVDEHLQHLRDDHGLSIAESGGVFRFVP